METTQEQPESAGAVGSTRLLDGFYRFGKGRKTVWMYVKDGIMWLPTAMMSPLIWMTAGKPITIVDKRSFMRAGDIIEEMPSQKAAIETLAAKHGLAV
jgi:hypothetical protein